ncbi:MAG: hypothetical protein KHW79_11740 [Clostridiales bacterium]|mgnify:FL=1|nr:hypothetical protein [Clostridiales bacterium]
MARTNAISLLSAASTPATLEEIYGLVIENVQKSTLSTALKSQMYTGNPAAGSVEFKRFVNSSSKAYGTARTAGKGDKVTAPPTTVNLSTHKEIVEEVAKFDIDTFGVADIMRRRADNHVLSMSAELDRAFFTEANTSGTAFTPASGVTDIQNIVESMIQTLETTKNDYVDGVDRSMMDLVLTPAKYGELRLYLDTQSNPNVDTAAEEFGLYHGVRVYSCTRMPADGSNITNALLMVRGAIAQPVVVNQYGAPEKIPLSNDYAVSLFYDYGTKALTSDLIYKWVTTV